MSYVALGTTVIGVAGGLATGGGGGGGAPAAPAGPQTINTTFGSVNFKSAGAGDRGKTTGAADAATQQAISAASAGQTPGWLWPVVAIVAVLGLALIFMPSRKK